MEPLVSAFSTIVGLIANYKSEGRAAADDEYKDFLSWLGERRHEEVVGLLETNAKAAISIKALLHHDREVLLSKLEAIDEMLASIASRIEGVGELAHAMKPGLELSEQAMSILRQVEAADASAFLIGKYLGGQIIIHLLDGNGAQVEFDEPRFLEDDLSTLVSLGFLILDYNRKGEPVYRFTRQASKLVKLSAH